MIRVGRWSSLTERALVVMRRIGRPVTASELAGAGGIGRAKTGAITDALQAACEAGLVTREERVEPYAYGSRVRVNRVYYALAGGGCPELGRRETDRG